MTAFQHGGPPRFAHQRQGLGKLIKTHGVGALLMDPGLGKSAIVLDYASLLALKSSTDEARVLVVCPLVAVDTWVSQAATFVSPQVGYWAEALSGSLLERAEALASRGGNPYAQPLTRRRPTPPRGLIETSDGEKDHVALCVRCAGAAKVAARASTVDRWWIKHLETRHPEYRSLARPLSASRALHHEKSLALGERHPRQAEEQYAVERLRQLSVAQGPDGVLGPRLVLEVINLDTLASRATYGSRTMADVMLGAIKRYGPDLVVIDESHKIKSVKGHASQLLSRLSSAVPRRVILTGTVAPAGPLDIFAQWRFLDPYAFGKVLPDGTREEAGYEEFKARYLTYGGWDRKEIKGYTNLDHMQEVMARAAVVARKDEALDLPPTTEIVVPVHLSPMEASAYAEMKKHLSVTLTAAGATSSVTNRLTQMLRLRQITSGHLPEDHGPVRVIGRSKAETIRSLVEDTLTGEKRIVIFALFSLEIKMLADLLAKPGTEIMVIEGGTSGADRLAMRQRFGSDALERMVMIAQVRTMSLAINELVTASHAIFASLSQQRDDLEQARARLDRQGQTRPVTFWMMIAPGTVDQVILQSHRDRTDLENALLRHINDN